MIVTSNQISKDNWKIFRVFVKGFEYSRRRGSVNTRFSLDTTLDYNRVTPRSTYGVSAEEVLDLLGEKVFKKLVELVWKNTQIKLFRTYPKKLSSFIKEIRKIYKYEEVSFANYHYWTAIYNKVLDLESSGRLRPTRY